MSLTPTARQWSQARLRVKNVIEGPNIDIDRFIENVARHGRLTPELLAAFPVLTQMGLVQRVEAAVRAALLINTKEGTP
ncbi:hypothetical protein [Paraburkholderia caribensis]|uniref:hypothetical protein n=1 Tax=Paraburkholderia caribensis TaxID=75105 RepID=UPI0028674853|nr:hypothetical protein [Paraburkholderia caribensis]MDR6382145.1 hypothetical protein [Paraburkholderia caribensis]